MDDGPLVHMSFTADSVLLQRRVAHLLYPLFGLGVLAGSQRGVHVIFITTGRFAGDRPFWPKVWCSAPVYSQPATSSYGSSRSTVSTEDLHPSLSLPRRWIRRALGPDS